MCMKHTDVGFIGVLLTASYLDSEAANQIIIIPSHLVWGSFPKLLSLVCTKYGLLLGWSNWLILVQCKALLPVYQAESDCTTTLLMKMLPIADSRQSAAFSSNCTLPRAKLSGSVKGWSLIDFLCSAWCLNKENLQVQGPPYCGLITWVFLSIERCTRGPRLCPH